jgi:hypothetical protein
MTILVDQTAELKAMIERLQAENQALKQNKAKNGLKVSAKGAVSMYGYGRFPITMYKETLRHVLSRAAELEQFMVANEDKLTSKGED